MHPMRLVALGAALTIFIAPYVFAQEGPFAVTITSGPDTETDSDSATFIFTASRPATLTCSLDGEAAQSCGTDTTDGSVAYEALAPGAHSFVLEGSAPDPFDDVGSLQDTDFREWTIAVASPSESASTAGASQSPAGGTTASSPGAKNGNLPGAATSGRSRSGRPPVALIVTLAVLLLLSVIFSLRSARRRWPIQHVGALGHTGPPPGVAVHVAANARSHTVRFVPHVDSAEPALQELHR